MELERIRIISLLFVISRVFSCPNDCSFKGNCNIYNQCECFEGFTDADCSRRLCPVGPAWTAPAIGIDMGHQEEECSNAGLCNRKLGTCECFDGFIGNACQRLACPASTEGIECSGHGKCLSMENHAKERPNHGIVSYGIDGKSTLSHISFLVDDDIQSELGSTETETRSWYQYNEVWDSSMIHGCVCDFPWTGYDCSQRECPRGDDPLTTGQRDEIQLIECNTTWRQQWIKLFSDTSEISGGTFALKYGPEKTRPMIYNASGTVLRSKLRALDGVGDDDGTDDVGKNVRGTTGGGVRVSVADGATTGDYIAHAWNLTFSLESDQYPVIPLYKQPEVQEFDCAADRGFFKLIFPSPWPTGSTFTKVCLGGTKVGEDCTTSDDCVDGLATGEGSKCGLKTWEEVKLQHDATQKEVAAALASFSLIDRVRVNFSDTSIGTGGGSVCTPQGNKVTITFLSTRLDYMNQGDIPSLVLEKGSSLKRTSVNVANSQGSTILTPIAREIVKGVDTCHVEEVQTISCRASGGTFTIALVSSLLEDTGNDDDADDGSIGGNDDDTAITTSSSTTVTLNFDATAAEVKTALEELPLIKNVSVHFDDQLNSDGLTYSDGGSFCNTTAAHKVTITFHALHEEFQHRLTRLSIDGGNGGDVPELTFSSASLTHDTSVILDSTATESVKGLACQPFDETYSTSGTRDDDRVVNSINNIQLPQMTSGAVHNNQDGGSFKIGFLGDYTSSISAAATSTDVIQALSMLPTLKGSVEVSFSGEHACQSPANVMQVTFLGDFGVSADAHRSGAYGRRNRAKLPPLAIDTNFMPSSRGVGENGTWAKPIIRVYTNGESDSSGTYFSQNSTKENDVCSSHGICIESTGICDCFTQSDFGYDHAFGSSDGRGGSGRRGDCGFRQSPDGDPRSVWHEGGASGSKVGGFATVKSSFSQQQPSVHERTWGLNFPITDCPGVMGCSGHGHCSGPPAYRCECAQGWQHAADCSERECPRAPAWFDYPIEPNRAHDTSGGGIECGGRGTCDRSTGECKCQAGFTGSSCALTECPGKTPFTQKPGPSGAAVECSGHGRCMNMKQLANIAETELGDAGGFTYGEDPNNPYTWDSERMRGCACDEGWTGADCSERTCPYGDDPNTHDDVTEVQLLNCTATSGEFTLSFRSILDDGSGRRVKATTIPMPHNVTAENMTKALEALSTIEKVFVVFSNDAQLGFCVGGEDWEEATVKEWNVAKIRFANEIGDLPAITADVSNLVNDPYGDLDDDKGGAGTGIIHVVTGGMKMHGISSVAGSRENLECSGRGVCNRNTGICDCFPGYASGDGKNGNKRGTRGDCGYLVGDRLLRVRGGVGDSDPDRAHGLEDIGREGGTSGNGGHQIGGSYPIEKPPDPSLSMRGSHQINKNGELVMSEGVENVPSSAQEVLDHVYQHVHPIKPHGNGYVSGIGRKILSFARHAFGLDSLDTEE